MNINKPFGQSEPVFIEDELQWLSAWQICAVSATLRETEGLAVEIEVLQEATPLTSIGISKDFTKNTATQARTSLLQMEKFSGSSRQCHV